MKILQILDNLSVDSGVSSVVMNFYRNINSEKIQFDFLVCRENENNKKTYYDEIVSMGGKVFYCGNPLSVQTFISSVRRIKLFFKKYSTEYQAVHLHVPTIAYFTLRYAKKFGIRSRIIHSHSSMTSPIKYKAFINYFLMKGKKYANTYWACSAEAAEFLFGKKAIKNVEIIRNTVDSEKFSFDNEKREAVRKDYKLPANKVIMHISNFSPIKNLDFLLPIIEENIKQNDNIRFMFVGDGPTKNKIEEKLKQSGLADYFIFTGRQRDVHKYLCAADLLLLPSLKEGLPVVVLEAQACGLTCLVSNTVTKECDVGNVVFFPLDENIWGDYIVKFCSPSCDIRRDMSASFKNCLYDAKKESARVEKLYLSLVKRD